MCHVAVCVKQMNCLHERREESRNTLSAVAIQKCGWNNAGKSELEAHLQQLCSCLHDLLFMLMHGRCILSTQAPAFQHRDQNSTIDKPEQNMLLSAELQKSQMTAESSDGMLTYSKTRNASPVGKPNSSTNFTMRGVFDHSMWIRPADSFDKR